MSLRIGSTNTTRNNVEEYIKSSNENKLETLFDDGKSVQDDSNIDSNTNQNYIDRIRNSVANGNQSKLAKEKASDKANKLKKNATIFSNYKVTSEKATVNKNKVTVNVIDENGNNGTVTFAYGSGGAYTTKAVFGDTTIIRVVDSNGNVRQKTKTNSKTHEKTVTDYDLENGKSVINRKVTTYTNKQHLLKIMNIIIMGKKLPQEKLLI